MSQDAERDFGPDGFLDYDPAPYERKIRESYAAAGWRIRDEVIDTKSIGQALQNWLIRNKMGIYHPLFVDSVDHAFENEITRLNNGSVNQEPKHVVVD